jgi:hypothetical protein
MDRKIIEKLIQYKSLQDIPILHIIRILAVLAMLESEKNDGEKRPV